MTTKFVIGAFAGLIALTLLIFWILRGGLFGSSGKTTSTPTPTLPTVSEPQINTTTPKPGTPPPVVAVKNHTNSELGLTFSYPQKFNLIAISKPATPSFPYTAYDFVFTTGKVVDTLAGQLQNSSGFGVFAAPHPAGRNLIDILNQEIAEGGGGISYNLVTKLGNSLETAKFSSGTQTLYALRSKNYVYYVIPFASKVVSADGSDDIAPVLEQVVAAFQFATDR